MKAALLFTFFLCIGAQVGAEILPVASVLKNTTVLHQCNAFFYTKSALLTTATCVRCLDCQFQITLQNSNLLGGKVYQVAEVKIHPNYTNDPIAYNVAILVLNEEPPGAVVLEPVTSDYLGRVNGTFYTWRYSDVMGFRAYPNVAKYVHKLGYYKATNEYTRDHDIAIQAYINVPIGPYDEGTPFIVKLQGFETPFVFGFFPKPRVQKPAKFFRILSIAYLFDESEDNFFYNFTMVEK